MDNIHESAFSKNYTDFDEVSSVPYAYWNYEDLSHSQSKSYEDSSSSCSYGNAGPSTVSQSIRAIKHPLSSTSIVTDDSLRNYSRKTNSNHFSSLYDFHRHPFPSGLEMGLTSIYDRSKTVSEKRFFYIFEIQFKRSSRICMGSEDDVIVDIGDYVCVTGDRGVDIGKVINRKPCLQIPSHQSFPILLNKVSPIEVSLLKDQRREECCVVRLCTQKAKQHNMDIVIVDAEFQFDRKKLTIYYYCHNRVDFRSFVKELYSIYYARIWMENVRPPIKHVPGTHDYDVS